MPLRISTLLDKVSDPPVAETKRWIAERTFTEQFPLIDVSQAVPGYPPAKDLQQRIAHLAHADTTSLYAPSLGLEGTRAALHRHLAREFGLASSAADSMTLDHLMITSGCNQAFCLAVGALCAPGDEVLVPTPFYFNHEMWLRANGIIPIEIPTNEADGMLPSIEALEAAVTATTRALVFVSPNNPCGVEYPPHLIEAGFEFAQRHDLAFILDETYKNFRRSEEPSHALFARPDWAETLVHLFSFSKLFSIPGYRVGSLIAAPHVLTAAMKLADCETIGAPRVSQLAVEYALDTLDGWVADRRRDMLARVEAFTSAMSAAQAATSQAPGTSPGYEIVSTGAFFAYVRHPFHEPAMRVARRLADDFNLLTIPGECFGRTQHRYLRMAFGNIDVHMIPEAVRRLQASISVAAQ